MKALGFFVIMVALAGCATVQELREGEPVSTGQSQKTAQVMSACVAEKWNQTYYNATSVPLADGFSIQILSSSGAGADAVLDVREHAGKTNYVLFERMPSMTSNKIERAVIDCK